MPSSSNNQCSVHMQAGTYLVGSGAQDGLHNGTRFTGARGGGFGQDFISLCLSLGPRSLMRLFPVRHGMAISQQMGASGSQTRRLTESQPSTTFCLATWPGLDRQGLTPLAGPGSSPQVATDLQGLVLKRTSVELALIIFYRCMWLLLFENRDGWNLRTCTNGRNPEGLERLPTSPTWC